jgi:ankyrin repeat protein
MSDLEMTVRLLDGGSDANERAASGSTALMVAVDRPGARWFRDTEAQIVDALVAAGADVNARTADGATPLHFAVRAGHRAVAMLLDRGADPDAATDDGRTPLHEAAEYCACQPPGYFSSAARAPSLVTSVVGQPWR